MTDLSDDTKTPQKPQLSTAQLEILNGLKQWSLSASSPDAPARWLYGAKHREQFGAQYANQATVKSLAERRLIYFVNSCWILTPAGKDIVKPAKRKALGGAE